MQPWPCYIDQLRTIPYMDAMHAEWLREYAEDAESILEWGCGGSTLWLLQITKARLLSVEHDEQWYDKIEELILALRGHGLGLSSGDLHHRPTHDRYCNQTGQYDLAFIDGKAAWRLDCLEACKMCVKPGGHIFMHDSQRYPSELFPFVTEHCQKSEQRIDSIGVGMWHGQLKG